MEAKMGLDRKWAYTYTSVRVCVCVCESDGRMLGYACIVPTIGLSNSQQKDGTRNRIGTCQ